MSIEICTGSGQAWRPGMGRPICPVCHRGPQGLKVPAPRKNGGQGWHGTVPAHANPYVGTTSPLPPQACLICAESGVIPLQATFAVTSPGAPVGVLACGRHLHAGVVRTLTWGSPVHVHDLIPGER